MTETEPETQIAASFRPGTPAELAEAVAEAVGGTQPLELVGTGTRRTVGRPVQAAAVLALDRLSGIQDYDPAELVLTCGAATPMRALATALEEAGQMFAFEPVDLGPLLGGGAGGGTLAGALSADFAGPRRIRAGAGRDHLLGFSGVSGRGTPFKAGGRVVKNVTGYDVSKLVAGAWGTLVAFDALSVKALPAPETTRTLLLHGLDTVRGQRALAAAMNSSHDVSGAAHLPPQIAGRSPVLGGAGAATLLRIEGFPTSVAARVDALAGELATFGAVDVLDDEASRTLWVEVRDVHYLAPPHTDPARDMVWRLSVPPTQGPAVAAAIAARADCSCFFDWAGGLVWAAVSGQDDGGAAAVRAAVAAEASSGHATLVRAPTAIRAAVPVFQPQPPALAALAERLKDQFDPLRLFNPGRMVAGL
ncbi:MAG: FAD-binding protein [Alphaproteobacteria bacterium]